MTTFIYAAILLKNKLGINRLVFIVARVLFRAWGENDITRQSYRSPGFHRSFPLSGTLSLLASTTVLCTTVLIDCSTTYCK